MTKITQKNFEAIKIYRQKEKLFELKGKMQSLEKENTKLKELLKECKSKLNYCTRETYELQTKINQALGEDK